MAKTLLVVGMARKCRAEIRQRIRGLERRIGDLDGVSDVGPPDFGVERTIVRVGVRLMGQRHIGFLELGIRDRD
ncbi:hypothetical protein TB2_015859 [Malus domestica]